MMAVLAILVEAIIQWFKIPIPWLQGRPSPSKVLSDIKPWLPEDEAEKAEARITALNKALKAIGMEELGSGVTVSELAEAVGEATSRFVAADRRRVGVIRVIAILVGTVLAFVFGIDTLELLSPLSGTIGSILAGQAGGWGLGFVLSGLASSAGSSFWHDQTARLRAAKTISEEIPRIAGQG